MEKFRCDWCLSNPVYIDYHDTEWGVPIYEDKKLFEALLLETFQAGLSWWSVLQNALIFAGHFMALTQKSGANDPIRRRYVASKQGNHPK